MVSIQVIKRRIDAVICREIAIASKEAEDFNRKKRENMAAYGLGGWYRQFEKAEERRKEHIEALEALRKAQGTAVILEDMRLYPFFCPSCQRTVYLDDMAVKNYREETIDCPICTRPIYRAAKCIEWKVQKGSRYARTRE